MPGIGDCGVGLLYPSLRWGRPLGIDSDLMRVVQKSQREANAPVRPYSTYEGRDMMRDGVDLQPPFARVRRQRPAEQQLQEETSPSTFVTSAGQLGGGMKCGLGSSLALMIGCHYIT